MRSASMGSGLAGGFGDTCRLSSLGLYTRAGGSIPGRGRVPFRVYSWLGCCQPKGLLHDRPKPREIASGNEPEASSVITKVRIDNFRALRSMSVRLRPLTVLL